MINMQQLWRDISALVSDNDLSPERRRSLFSIRGHSPYMNRHRAAVINSRTRIIASAFAALTLIWVPLDFWILPADTAGILLVLRLLSTAFFIYLALPREGRDTPGWARLQLAMLLFNPLVFYLAAQLLFARGTFSGLSEVFVDIYNLLPFIIVAGLSVFPLTLLEAVSFGAGSLAVMGAGPLLSGNFAWGTYFPAAWILLLLLCVCVLAASIQLNYMMSLLHRISSDPLTGAFSRDSGSELVDLYFHIALEQGTPFAIAFVDLDRFKEVNDNYGHEMGDDMLKVTVKALHQQLRVNDMVVRWGGEEFLLLLPGMQPEGIRMVLLRLMRTWLGTRPDGSELTASIGIAERITDGVEDWPQLIELADKRMYRAKAAGRARAVMFENQVVLPPDGQPIETEHHPD